jgi:hypothetical protein
MGTFLTTLGWKREGIEKVIAFHQSKIDAAKFDLAAVDRALALFDHPPEKEYVPAYLEIGRLWERGESAAVCREALEREGPLNTLELAERVIAAKGVADLIKWPASRSVFRVVRASDKLHWSDVMGQNEAKRKCPGGSA